jgi:hypothetical protein
MLISAIILFPRIYNFAITDRSVSAAWQDLITRERAIYISRTGRLHDYLKSASTTRLDTQDNNCSLPDLFYLFSTVLKLFMDKFVRDSMSSYPSQLPGDSERSTGRSKSGCPVMNGEIQNTDYWDLLMNIDNSMEPFDSETAANFDINDPLYFDLSSWINFPV